MNVFRRAANDYFAVRRALGFKLVRSEKLIAQFITYLEQQDKTRVTTEMAVAWAVLPQAGQAWSYARLSVVRRFANYMRSIDPATEVPPTHILVQNKGRATPYIYSKQDLNALVDTDADISVCGSCADHSHPDHTSFCDGHAYW